MKLEEALKLRANDVRVTTEGRNAWVILLNGVVVERFTGYDAAFAAVHRARDFGWI